MANRIRRLDEKVKSVSKALSQIDIEEAARETGVPASTLRYDLVKVRAALPEILDNQDPGPKPQCEPAKARAAPADTESKDCPQCGGKVTKNGTYWVLRSACIGKLAVDAEHGLVGCTAGVHSTPSLPGLWV
jgi:hypothetical protein